MLGHRLKRRDRVVHLDEHHAAAASDDRSMRAAQRQEDGRVSAARGEREREKPHRCEDEQTAPPLRRQINSSNLFGTVRRAG